MNRSLLRGAIITAAAGTFVVFGATISRAQVVTACGEVVANGASLAGDLDCTGFAGPAVTVASGNLNLAGFVLTGGDDDAVLCETTCTVYSNPPGGTILGAGARGIGHGAGGVNGITQIILRDATVAASGGIGVQATRVKILNATVDGSGLDGVRADFIKLVGATLSNNAFTGAWAGDTISAKDSVVVDNASDGLYVIGRLNAKRTVASSNAGTGLIGQRMKAVDCTADDNGYAGMEVNYPGGTIARVTANGNGSYGIFGAFKAKDVTANGNGFAGVRSGLPLKRITATDNGVYGIAFNGGKLRDSLATGNGTSPDCGVAVTCADIASYDVPILVGTTTCGTSYQQSSGFPGSSYGVCTLD